MTLLMILLNLGCGVKILFNTGSLTLCLEATPKAQASERALEYLLCRIFDEYDENLCD